VLVYDVVLDFPGTSPQEIAERAASPGHVLFLHVSFKLLDATEVVVVAIDTDRSRSTANGPILISGILHDVLDGEVPSSSVGLGIVAKLSGACVGDQNITTYFN
jgi:hypothetical protein